MMLDMSDFGLGQDDRTAGRIRGVASQVPQGLSHKR
jgi:hypothetical protein